MVLIGRRHRPVGRQPERGKPDLVPARAAVRRLGGDQEASDSKERGGALGGDGRGAEAAGDHTAAAELYQQAAERWRQFGNVPERAYALLGQGRCLATLGKPEAEGPLREARDLFTTLAYQPALAESRALLGESEAAAV